MSACVIVDCANLDAVLGFEILNHKPFPWERLAYDRFQTWSQQVLKEPAHVVAVIREGEGTSRLKRLKFAQALHTAGVRVVFAETYASLHSLPARSGREIDDDVVRDLIARSSARTIVYAGHDFYAADALRAQRQAGARVFAACFPEHLATDVIEVIEDAFDLEHDINAFRQPLPRMWCGNVSAK